MFLGTFGDDIARQHFVDLLVQFARKNLGIACVVSDFAKEYVDRIMPEIVIPMHYKTRSLNLDLDKADAFLDLFDDEETEISGLDTLEFSREDLTEEKTKIILMERTKK